MSSFLMETPINISRRQQRPTDISQVRFKDLINMHLCTCDISISGKPSKPIYGPKPQIILNVLMPKNYQYQTSECLLCGGERREHVAGKKGFTSIPLIMSSFISQLNPFVSSEHSLEVWALQIKNFPWGIHSADILPDENPGQQQLC